MYVPFNEMLLLIISQTLNLIYYLLNSTILRFTTHCSTHAAFYFLSNFFFVRRRCSLLWLNENIKCITQFNVSVCFVKVWIIKTTLYELIPGSYGFNPTFDTFFLCA